MAIFTLFSPKMKGQGPLPLSVKRSPDKRIRSIFLAYFTDFNERPIKDLCYRR